MNQYKKWQAQLICREMVTILAKKGYDAHYAEDLDEAREKVLSMIPPGASIALGGSETIAAMGLIETFRRGDYRLFDRYQKLPYEEILEIMRQSLLADFLVTGTNAITRAGELVNIDCTGNRLAGMIFGPRRVIVVAGANKVVDDLAEAMRRLKKIAPLNAKRIEHATPCAETGRCQDCEGQKRLCNYVGLIYHGRKFPGRISVIMVAEEVGF
ncbi:MAG: lactate utilization protein [Firmicutes bacterium]|nr:lactate utilization protein [Bacillota bacterium]